MAAGNVFTIAPNDQSIYYLGQIFGTVGDVLTPAGSNEFLGTLFKSINTIALTVGALVLVYITVVGLLATAHEGEFLGKKWSGLWVPIRSVLGVVCLFPASSGYSAIQMVVMWIIVQGVGAADLLWNSAVDYVAKGNAPTGSAVSASAVYPVMEAFFQGLVCQQMATKNVPGLPNIQYYAGNNNNQPYTVQPFSAGQTTYAMGPNGSCGTLNLCDLNSACSGSSSNTPGCWACQAQSGVMNSIYASLNTVASEFAQDDTDYVTFYNTDTYSYDKNLPKMIKSYCDYKGVANNTCCKLPPASSPLTICDTNLAWPSDHVTGNSIDFTNLGTDTMSFYEQWDIYPILPGMTGSPGKLTPTAGSDFVTLSTNQYVNTINTTVAGKLASNSSSTDWKTDAKDAGWITAGIYYYKISNTNAAMMASAVPLFGLDTGNGLPGSDMQSVRNNYSGVDVLVQDLAKASQPPSGGLSSPSYMGSINTSLNSAQSGAVQNFINALQNNKTDPLLNIAAYGHSLIQGAESLYVTVPAVWTAVAAIAGFNMMGVGTGPTLNPVGEGLKQASGFFSPVFFAFLGVMVSFGALLSLYIPMIPYVVFTVTALGWFIATIEAMVAAPLVALGILGPGGQHEILGRAEPSLMILFNLFLRPMLMVFGLMAAMLLINVMLQFINAGFLGVMGDIVTPDLVEQFFFIGIYVSLLFAVVNKVFTLIHIIPERVLTYIGGHAIQYGEGEVSGGVKHGVEAAAAGTAMAMKGGAESGAGAGAAISGKKMQASEGATRQDTGLSGKAKPDQ